jgi:hypothetical protein
MAVSSTDILASRDQQVTSQRFEMKYILTESQALAVSENIRPYVDPDVHAESDHFYRINSLYLDNDNLDLYWASELGHKNRFKLRIRSYSDRPEDPVFLEIKRRVDRVVLKRRVGVHRDCISALLRGERLSEDCLLSPSAKSDRDMHAFQDLMLTCNATPRSMVYYVREAYMSAFGESVRITFDRDVAGRNARIYSPNLWTVDGGYHPLCTNVVILEIKFSDVYPRWVEDIVYRLHLMRDSFAKYVACVKHLNRAGDPVQGAFPNPLMSHHDADD